jgi:hypothetical protein
MHTLYKVTKYSVHEMKVVDRKCRNSMMGYQEEEVDNSTGSMQCMFLTTY